MHQIWACVTFSYFRNINRAGAIKNEYILKIQAILDIHLNETNQVETGLLITKSTISK